MTSRLDVERWRALADAANEANLGTAEGVSRGLDLAFAAQDAVPEMAALIERMASKLACASVLLREGWPRDMPSRVADGIDDLLAEYRGEVPE
jgi:hypothetical protein